MRAATALCVCVLLAGVALTAATKRPRKRVTTGNEPFRTFELMDSKLTELGRRQESIKASIPTQAPGKATTTKPNASRRWSREAALMERAAASVRRLARRQEKRYGSLKQRFGVRTFRAIANRAVLVEKDAKKLKGIRDQIKAEQQRAALEKSNLELVLQFQAVTGGYGALHCESKQIACCEPKPDADGNQAEGTACKWVCVASAAKCAHGFTGPRTARAAKAVAAQ